LIAIGLSLLIVPSIALAADSYFVRPGILPDSAIYFLDRFSEEVRYFFTFGKVNKADYKIRQAEERLAELKIVYEKGVREKTEELLTDYKNEITAAQNLYEQVKVTTVEKAIELQDETETTIIMHESGVQEYLQSVPEQLDSAVTITVGVTSIGFDNLLQHLREKRQQIEAKKADLGIID
jgi:sugar-specific transcriptional regulator TrmB